MSPSQEIRRLEVISRKRRSIQKFKHNARVEARFQGGAYKAGRIVKIRPDKSTYVYDISFDHNGRKEFSIHASSIRALYAEDEISHEALGSIKEA